MDFLPSKHRNPLLALTENTHRLHQDWCVHYWSDEEMGLAVNSMPNDIFSTYPLLNMGVMRADTARLAIMFAYGGWYLDTDILCTRPVSELVAPGEELVLVEQPSTAMHGGGVANFLMGSAPKHPLWNATLTHIARHATSQLHGLPGLLLAKNASYRQVLAITGSQAITHAWRSSRSTALPACARRGWSSRCHSGCCARWDSPTELAQGGAGRRYTSRLGCRRSRRQRATT